jgi:hypothetical protein
MSNLLDPSILFFVFGALAGLIRSNLEIPPQVSRFLSLYLLMALGLKGGFALAKSGLTLTVVSGLGIAVVLAILVPLIGYWVLRRFLNGFDAIALAATYGSVSAVTFITATQHLENIGLHFGGHMSASMALMESPAIVIGVVLANLLRRKNGASEGAESLKLSKVLHESFTDGAQLLLLGAMVIGILTGERGQAVMHPFSVDLFKGMLAFFLLDMGLLAARNFKEVLNKSKWVIAYGIGGPITHAALALLLCKICGIPAGDGALLMTLAASASYIAVPAVLRFAIPEANPSLYFGLSLGLTFPLNIVLGIPFYAKVAAQCL